MRRPAEQSKTNEGRRPRWVALRARAVALVGLGAVAGVLVSCSSTATTPPANSDGSTASTSSAIPAPKQWAIKAADLPQGQGWRNSNPPDGSFRVTLCGVDIEPVLAVRAGAWRWSQSGVGPFLEQHVRVYRDDQAREVISALQKALPTCTRTKVPRSENSSEKVTFSIKPITVAGAGPDSVAWQQTLLTDQPVTSEYFLTRRGRTAVLFVSYSLGSALDRNVLVRAAEALKVKPLS
jgi:hypothetical protein